VCSRRHLAIEIDGSGHKNKLDADQKRPPLNPLDRGDFDSFTNWKDVGNDKPKRRMARDEGKDGLTHPIFVDINKDLNSYHKI
jgi:hypothetical protein